MRRNAAGQNIQAMMRLSSADVTAIVPVTANLSVSSATAASPGVFTTASHSFVVGQRVTISGGTSSWAAANGDWVINTAPAVTTFSVAALSTGTPLNTTGFGALSGTVVVTSVPVHVMVTKDGGTPTLGAGTLTHIGQNAWGGAFTATQVSCRAHTAVAAASGASTVTTLPGTQSSTLGLWSYNPTAAETNAASVAFTFIGSARTASGAGIAVTQTFEPTSGPILYQALLSATGGAVTNQTTIVLPSATPIPSADDDSYNGCEIVFYDGSTSGQCSVGVVLDYVGSTRTITLREAPTFTVTTSDYVTIVANQSLQSATKDRRLVVDASGLADANTVKIGPTGSGTAQTARDVGASVLLSSGTGAGQLSLTSGKVDLSATGLNAIPVENPSGVADTFPKMAVQLWRRFFKKATKTATQIKTYADDGTTVVTTQTISDDGTTQTQGVSS